MSHQMASKLACEFVGTFTLVFCVGCNVLSKNTPGFAVLSIASSLMVMIYALGGVSGAHFNPAVTVAVSLTRKMEGGWSAALQYIGVQLVAGVIAGLSYVALFGESFDLEPGHKYNWVSAGVVEACYTGMLCLVVLLTACDRKTVGNQYFGLAIGFVIVAGGIAGGSISGGAFNPAVALGIDFSSSLRSGFGWSIAYWGFELIGAGAAAIIFSVVRPSECPQGAGHNDPPSTFSKIVSEFLGTFFLVLTVGFCAAQGITSAALSIASSLMVMIYALGHVSGAHFNPAVTISILVSGRGKTNPTEAMQYIGAQLFGGLVGSLTASTIVKTVPLSYSSSSTLVQAMTGEVIFTFVLCFVVLTVATVKEPSKDMFGLAIGMCVVVGGFAIGGISGGSLNPAVSFGLDATYGARWGRFGNCAVYTVAEVVGGILASLLFLQTHVNEHEQKAREPVAYGSS